jgi:hypothetical protein
VEGLGDVKDVGGTELGLAGVEVEKSRVCWRGGTLVSSLRDLQVVQVLTCDGIQQPILGSKHLWRPDDGGLREHLPHSLLTLVLGAVELGL